MTTHSPNLASKVPLESLIICKNNNAFPMETSTLNSIKKTINTLNGFLMLQNQIYFSQKDLS